MSTEKDLCPISDNGNHRYFIFKASEVFVPVEAEYRSQSDVGAVEAFINNRTLYEKKSIVVSGCNCGASLVQEVPIV